MKRTVRKLQGDSLLVGDLPKGCKLCSSGTKMVLFVTGLCDSSCYYCPLSQEKGGKDVVFADEMPVETAIDIIEEANAIGAHGVGVSGGDPLCRLDRTLTYISFLKEKFGEEFHIHLYTSQNKVDIDTLKQLQSAGLDEIRFHPQDNDWSGIEHALSLGMVTGLELPAIPGEKEKLIETAKRADDMKIDFFNINELETSETNFQKLISMGMRLTNLSSSSIAGSKETAISILEWGSKELEYTSLHFCSAKFKDIVQLRTRLERRLDRTIRTLEEKEEEEPIVVLGVIRAEHGKSMNMNDLLGILEIVRQKFDVPPDLVNLDENRNRIEIAPWILETIAEELKDELSDALPIEMGIAHEYPSWDRLQVLFEPV
ncbi:radical SAM protein [Candidatus Thorarchaeota archaeon]|nr:MAG: radical SAM protein [Candidatus Thorarchaeota archaeon]